MSPASHRPIPGATGTAPDPLARAILWTALVVGLSRFALLGRWSLWLDEAFTLADARHRTGIDNPLGYFLFDLVYRLSSTRPSEFLLRLPAAVFGWATLPLAYFAFRPLLGRRPAACVVAVLATSSWHLYNCQIARFYTLAQALALTGGAVFIGGVGRGSRRLVALGIAGIALAPLAHPSALLLGVPLLLLPWVALALDRPPVRDIEKVPWNLLSLCAFLGAAAGAGWSLDVWSTYQAQKGGGSTLHLILSAGYFVTPTLGVGFALGAWRALWKGDDRAFLPLAVALPALLFAFLASLFVRVSAQYVFVILPWIAAVAAAPLARDLTPRRTLGYLLFLVLPGTVDSGLYFFRNGDRPRWREAYAYVFEHRRPGDLLFGMDAPVGEYYQNPWRTDLRNWRTVTWLDRFRARQVLDWQRYGRPAWYVVNREQLADWDAEKRRAFEDLLAETCELVATYPVDFTPRDLEVRVYRSPPRP